MTVQKSGLNWNNDAYPQPMPVEHVGSKSTVWSVLGRIGAVLVIVFLIILMLLAAGIIVSGFAWLLLAIIRAVLTLWSML